MKAVDTIRILYVLYRDAGQITHSNSFYVPHWTVSDFLSEYEKRFESVSSRDAEKYCDWSLRVFVNPSAELPSAISAKYQVWSNRLGNVYHSFNKQNKLCHRSGTQLSACHCRGSRFTARDVLSMLHIIAFIHYSLQLYNCNNWQSR